LLSLGVAQRLQARQTTLPVFVSANVPGGDECNGALKQRYPGRMQPDG